MVCIIDDRDDVWSAAPNLVLVKKYSYFPGKLAYKFFVLKKIDMEICPSRLLDKAEVTFFCLFCYCVSAEVWRYF